MEKKTRLYVGHLDYEAEERDIEMHFKDYGLVAKVILIRNQDTGESRGYAFVEMMTPEDAAAALSADGSIMMGKRLKVSYALPKKKQS